MISNMFLVYGLITIVVAMIVAVSKLQFAQIENLSFRVVWIRFKALPHLAKIVFFVWLLSKLILLGIVGITMSIAPQYLPYLKEMVIPSSVDMQLNGISVILAVFGGYVGDRVLITLSKRLGLDISKEYSLERTSAEENTPIEDILNEEE